MANKTSKQIEEVVQVIEYAGYEFTEYSGRNMYGRVCIGFTHDHSDFRIAAELVEAAFALFGSIGETLDALKDAKTDNMGREYITYFPAYEPRKADADDPYVTRHEDQGVMCDP